MISERQECGMLVKDEDIDNLLMSPIDVITPEVSIHLRKFVGRYILRQ